MKIFHQIDLKNKVLLFSPIFALMSCNGEVIAGFLGRLVGILIVIFGIVYWYRDIKKKREISKKYRKNNF